MGLRFRRSMKVFPGVRLNFSSRGVSTTIGGRGASVNIGKGGSYLNLNLPGGLAYRQWLDRPDTQRVPAPSYDLPLQEDWLEPTPNPRFLSEPVFQEGEIRSGSNDEITSVGLRALRQLLAESHVEYHRSLEELPAIRAQSESASARAHKWERGRVLKHLLKKRYASIQQDSSAAKLELDELEKQIETCRIALEIDLEAGIESTYGALLNSFRALAACERSWDATAETDIDRVRERSSASFALTRSSVTLDCSGCELLLSSRSAMRFPNANGGDLFLYPGMLLVYNHAGSFALIDLNEVRVEYSRTRFIESERVPVDAPVVGETWEKVNKDGSRDRRFADNRKLPVVEYGTLRFVSAAGLNEEYLFSNPAKAEKFKAAFSAHQASLAK